MHVNEISTVSGQDQQNYLVSKRYAWFIFFLVWILGLFDFIDRQVISALFPYLKAEWGLSDAQLGALVGIVNVSMSVIVFPTSLLIDRWSRKKTIWLMGTIWSLATIGCAFTKNFGQLFTARIFIGAGEGGYGPGACPLLSALFPERLRATVLGLLNTISGAGGIIGVLVGGYIAVHYGWRYAFGIVGIPGLILATIFLFIRDYKTIPLQMADKEKGGTKKMDKREIVRQFISTPSLILTYFAAAAGLFYAATVLNWMPTFFQRVYNLPMDKASMKAAVVLLVMAVGVGLGGIIVDRWKVKWRRAAMFGPFLFLMVTFVFSTLAFGVVRGPGQFPMILLGTLLMGAIVGPSFNVTQTVVHPGLRATAAAFLILFQNLLGMALGPFVTGILSDRYELQTALTIVAFFPLLGAVLYLIGSFYFDKDVAKTEQVSISME
jgi:MFS transporter, Spinster family, sphingosine-1-phosphate transporter